jgi:hypothetical protein
VKSRRSIPLALTLLLLGGGALFCQEDPIAWLNAVRREAHVPPVSADALLSETAAGWAARLAASGVLTHRGDDGSTGLDRYRARGGTEVRVGEILGAGTTPGRIERAWMASPDHRAVALSVEWTHAGWGSAAAGPSLVMVMMFTRKLVDGLSVVQDDDGLHLSGRFLPPPARGGLLYNGLDPVLPELWDPARRAFQFFVPARQIEGYLRLGYLGADGAFTLTNTVTVPLTSNRPGRQRRPGGRLRSSFSRPSRSRRRAPNDASAGGGGFS